MEQPIIDFSASKHCDICGRDWFHIRRPADELLQRHFGFDVVGAMDTLLDTHHASHDRPARAKAYWDAYHLLFVQRRTLGPEQLSRIEVLKALKALRKGIQALADAVENARDGWAWNRIFPVLLGTVSTSRVFLRRVCKLEERWGKDTAGRPLIRDGRPSKRLLADVEDVLIRAGLEPIEVGRLGLDGEPARTDELASDRVQKRRRALKQENASEDVWTSLVPENTQP